MLNNLFSFLFFYFVFPGIVTKRHDPTRVHISCQCLHGFCATSLCIYEFVIHPLGRLHDDALGFGRPPIYVIGVISWCSFLSAPQRFAFLTPPFFRNVINKMITCAESAPPHHQTAAGPSRRAQPNTAQLTQLEKIKMRMREREREWERQTSLLAGGSGAAGGAGGGGSGSAAGFIKAWNSATPVPVRATRPSSLM